MGIANYSTSVEAIKTIGEIEVILVKHGAKSILTNYNEDGTVESLSFIVKTAYGDMPIRLPVNAEAILRVMQRDRQVPRHYCTHPQAVRVVWRILRDWVRAQMAILETEMVKMEQIFLPYMITKNEQTLYEAMVDKKFYLEAGVGVK